MLDPLVITASMLRSMVVCDRQFWLDIHGDRSKRDQIIPSQSFALSQGIRHENAVQQAVAPQVQPISIHNWSEGIEASKRLMKQGVRQIGQAYLELFVSLDNIPRPLLLRGKTDWLECHSTPATGQWVYSPKEVKQYRTMSDADRLQLDLYTWMLMRLQNTDTLLPEFWLRGSDGTLVERIPHRFEEQRLLTALERAAWLLTTTEEPAVVIKPACRQCHWQSSCREIAQSTLDISILPRLTQQSQKHLRSEGITTLAQLAVMTAVQLRCFKGIKTLAEAFIAHAQAFVSHTPVWYGSLPERVLNGGWIFDIETVMPQNKDVWSIGWSDLDGNVKIVMVNPSVALKEGESYHEIYLTKGQTIFVAPDPASAWRIFSNSVDDVRPIFHWGNFDNSVMKNNAPEDVRLWLDNKLIDLCRTFDHVVKCPIDSSSLKVVTPFIAPGFKWHDQGNAFEAYMYYESWLSTGELQLLTHAAQYQSDDVQAVLLVWKWLINH